MPPKCRSRRCKTERKIKIAVEPMESILDCDNASNSDLKEPNALNLISSNFPKIISKILHHLPHSTHKALRLTSKPLKQSVDQYVGLSFILSESNTDYDISNKIQILSKDLLNSLKHIGIRYLKGLQLTKTKFFEIITFPYLLQSVHLFGQIDQQILLGLLKECWNLRSLKLQEPNQYQMLIRGDFIDFMRSIGILIEKRKAIQLKHLKHLKIHCSTTSTMGYMLVVLSALETHYLESLHCCIGPVHANFYPLITSLLVNVINNAHQTLKDFWLIVESSDAYPEVTAKRRFIRKLNIFSEDFSETLPTFEEAFKKLYWEDEERDKWLKNILSMAGAKTTKLTRIRLDIDTMEDFSKNWIYFLKHQYNLSTLELQACCHWSIIEDIIKQNAKTLDTLAIVMEFNSPMDLKELMQDCTGLKRLILKNFDFDLMNPEQLEMRRTGHIINAKFDELFPHLENLALSNLFIRSTDLHRVTKMYSLKDFLLSLYEMDVDNGDFLEPNNMFGLLYEDFKILIHLRNLNHIVVSKEAVIFYGSLEKRLRDTEKLEMLIKHPMFHSTNILGWQLLTIDEEHIAVAHGETVKSTDWIFPLIMSIIEDTVEADAISFRSLVSDEDG